jgi:nicotinate-nucleotide adenylyltransferase
MSIPLQKIAILGGAFDPPTIGHFSMAQAVLMSKTADCVWIMPCSGHQSKKYMSSADQRLKMCQLTAEHWGNQNIVVSDYEIKNKLSGATYHTVKKLIKEFPEKQFFVTIGMDNANEFDKWVKYKELIKMVPFIVFSRQKISKERNDVTWYKKSPHIYMKCKILDTSSSKTREMLKNIDYHSVEPAKILDSLADSNIVDNVLEYIIENNLYKDRRKGESSHDEKTNVGV